MAMHNCLIALFFISSTLVASLAPCQQAPSSTEDVGGIGVHSDEAIPVGPFIFSPALQLAWQDRDNIFFTPDNEIRDQLILAKAQLLFEVPIYESYLRFSYTPQYRDYKDYELDDKWQHFFDAAAAFEFSSGLTLNLGYSYIIGNLETREVDPGGTGQASCLAQLFPVEITRARAQAEIFTGQVDGIGAEAQGDEAVEGGGSAAALQVAENHGSRLLAGSLVDLVGDLLPDAAENHLPTAALCRTLGDHLAASIGCVD